MSATMAKKKKQTDLHLSGFLIRLPEVYRDQLRKLKERTRRPMTEDVKIALEEYLKNHGLWPPSAGG
jgi:predicted DNA-binding protein